MSLGRLADNELESPLRSFAQYYNENREDSVTAWDELAGMPYESDDDKWFRGYR